MARSSRFQPATATPRRHLQPIRHALAGGCPAGDPPARRFDQRRRSRLPALPRSVRPSFPRRFATLLHKSAFPKPTGVFEGRSSAVSPTSVTTLDAVTRVKRGIAGELALEWGPSFLHNQILGLADYNRTTLGARASYRSTSACARRKERLLELSRSVRRARLGNRARDSRNSSEHRRTFATVGSRRFGTRLRLGTFRLDAQDPWKRRRRANLPAIVLPQIVPGLVLYTDAGYFSMSRRYPPSPTNSGFLLSNGAGFYLDLFAAAELVFYTNYLWTEPDVEGEPLGTVLARLRVSLLMITDARTGLTIADPGTAR